MKQIEPVQVWTNGSVQEGTLLNAYIINDNLSDSATFYWQIFSSDAEGNAVASLAEGNLTINEPDYDVWGSSADINLAAYQWIASQLSLTLIA